MEKIQIHVIQCDSGFNQGTMNERGFILREVQNIQLLECCTGICHGTPKSRVGKFVSIGFELREIRWQEPRESPWTDRGEYWYVTLHGDHKLPADLVGWVPKKRSH